ncbi:hypothetical protein QUF90_04130 [Desulfococcaceae bacterium HSG9]|nr:hypothetical protein [Desulfococcaceae bacterium HSG9]
MKSFNYLTVLVGIGLISFSVYYPFANSKKMGVNIRKESSLSSFAIPNPSLIGGGGTRTGLLIETYHLKPFFTYPEETNPETGIHVSAHLELYDIVCTRMLVSIFHDGKVFVYDPVTRKTSKHLLDEVYLNGIEVYDEIKRKSELVPFSKLIEEGASNPFIPKQVRYSKLTNAEKDHVTKYAKRVLEYEATLNIAGLSVKPTESIPLNINNTVWWSVKPEKTGNYAAVFDFRRKKRSYENEEAEILGQRTFSIKVVSAFNSNVKTIISILGGILGALLASLPAWITWYESRVKKIKQPNKANSADAKSRAAD